MTLEPSEQPPRRRDHRVAEKKRVMHFIRTRKGRYRVRALLILAALLCGFGVAAQQAAPPEALPAPVLRVTTRLVLVDVVVTDKKKQPVTDLTLKDFSLQENGKPQRIAFFALEQPARRAPEQEEGIEPPPLPPHVYTNRPEYRIPPGRVILVLLDALNTSVRDQAAARAQLLRYLAGQLQPGRRTAILALTNRLLLLQDFTADPRLLLAALEKYKPQKSAPRARAEKIDRVIDPIYLSPSPEILANIERFQAEQVASAMDTRVRITLAALQRIARATAGYPGRKSLVWVSSAFPITFAPGRIGNFPRSYADAMRRTTNMLADARIALYVVDARGLVGTLIGDASNPLRNPVGNVRTRAELHEALARYSTQIEAPQQAMNHLAADTGGRAFYNRNDIDKAVALSVEDGSTYYALAYYPENKDWDGKFRRIQVKVARRGLRVRHRRGYYATDPTPPKEEAKTRQEKLLAVLNDPLPATAIAFRAQVPPPAPADPAQVVVQFKVDPRTVAFEEVEDGRQRCNLDFLVAAVSPGGQVVAVAHQTLEARLRPETYAGVQQAGLPFRLALTLGPGRYRLRLAVRDNRTGWLGTLEVPLVVKNR
ncbi:MAG: VWA domain-containing protein [Terriglobia bacterium]